jgi:hypothetical protein
MLPYTVLRRECEPADHEPHSVLPLLLMQHSLPRRNTFGFWFGVDVSISATRQCLQRVTTVWYMPPPCSSFNFNPWINTERHIFLKQIQLYIHQICGSVCELGQLFLQPYTHNLHGTRFISFHKGNSGLIITK